MSSKFSSTKVIPLGSTAFRQPYATSHCRYLHGYRLQAKFWFTCNTLDNNNWVVDFGALNEFKTILEEKFDHATCISSNDPQRPLFELLHEKGVIDLRIFDNGVGIEKFAEYCLNAANIFVKRLTQERCWCEKVEVWEHEGNSAVYEKLNISNITLVTPGIGANGPLTYDYSQIVTTTVDTQQTPVLISEVKQEVPTPQPTIIPIQKAPDKIIPQYTDKSKNTYKDLFKGTSWGNPTK